MPTSRCISSNQRCRYDAGRTDAAAAPSFHARGQYARRMPPLHLKSVKEKDGTKKEKDTKMELEKKVDEPSDNKKFIAPLVLAAVAIGAFATGHALDIDKFLDESVEKVAQLGPYGYVYFALVSSSCKLYALRSTLYALCSTLYALRSMLYALLDTITLINSPPFPQTQTVDLHFRGDRGHPRCAAYSIKWVSLWPPAGHSCGAV
jgi:hypothetical protein